jgi:hypothetical protein
MSFRSTVNLVRVLKTRLFDIPDRGAVTVTCDGHMDRPAPCRVPTYSIELEEKGLLFDSSHGEKAYPANGSKHSESWHDLPSGRYYLIISISNTDPNCHLIGTITVTSATPTHERAP